ncbi:MAG: hypothetical protein V8Q83_09590 [Blautia sp.]
MKKFSPKQEKTETKMKTWAEESADTADEEKLTEKGILSQQKRNRKNQEKEFQEAAEKKERTRLSGLKNWKKIISKYGEDVDPETSSVCICPSGRGTRLAQHSFGWISCSCCF